MKKLLRYLWLVITPFLAAETIMLITVSVFQIIFQGMVAVRIGITQGAGQLRDAEKLSQAAERLMSREMAYLISVAAVLICGIIFYFWYQRDTAGYEKRPLVSVASLKNLYQFVMLGIGCQLFFSGVMNLVRPAFPEQFENYGETMRGIFGANILLVFIYTTVIAPVSEELIFRGVILFRARKVLPYVGANLLQALFFGIYHGNIIQGIYAAVTGFLLGLLNRKYRSIYASILVHIMINASVVVVTLFPETMAGYTVMTVIGAGTSALIFLRLRLWKEIGGIHC